MVQEQRPLRFGIICHGTTFPDWQARCLRQLVALAGVEAALLIIVDRPPPPHARGGRLKQQGLMQGLVEYLYFSLYVRWRSRALQPVDLAALLAGVPALRCEGVGSDRLLACFRDEDLAAIRAYNLDFILQLGSGSVGGEILRLPRYGVWSFSFGGAARYAGGPACFWEVYRGDATTGATLQRLTDSPSGGVVLQTGACKTFRHSYLRSLDEVLLRVGSWPAQVCKDIQNGAAAYLDINHLPSTVPIFRRPTGLQMVLFLLKMAWKVLVGAYNTFFRAEQWNVGIVDMPIQTFLVANARPPVRWLPELPSGCFIADPFGLDRDTSTAVLVEMFDYRTGRGYISALELRDDGSLSPPRPVIKTPVHMSYPYLVEHGGDIYCIPESHLARGISLYKATAFPYQWIKHTTLIEGFAGGDATVFQHDGRWWLLCCDHEPRLDYNTALNAWYAPTLFGPWVPHANNPVKTDVRSSRPAGTPFVHAAQLYRPAQDCSRTYGGAVTINRVLRLTPTEFAEEPVSIVEPYADSPYPHGLHTLTAVGQRTIIDSKRRYFIWQATLHVVFSLVKGRLGLRRNRAPRDADVTAPTA